ncbi:cupin domain-containing protein [Rothia sp. AR01]|uniref:Cupin domain-containing protein n=1 Tax=Rothia santali TaxID=2949643 RepID=A0A9X2HK37_9MICC|nr:cupin domain-containing protein [Rothia santali]MCP3426363.1 cupin domain-containing protein [Rothia santali]
MTVPSSFDSLILRPNELPCKDRGGGARTVPLVTYARGGTTFLNGTTIFEPGAQIGHHTHNVVESVVVISGKAIVDIDGQREELATFDTTFVPANIPHHFENASETEEMRILWTYASVDATRTLVDSGEQGRIDGEADASEVSDPPLPAATAAVIEVVNLHVRPGAERAFETAVAQAGSIFQHAAGARTFELVRQVEDPQLYRLSIRWSTLEDHTEGFRGSAGFSRWRELVTPHLSSPPQASHYSHVLTAF